MEVKTWAERLLFTTVRIEANVPGGVSTGTAFVFKYTWNGMESLFLVTNKHVVADATEGRFFFTLKGEDGRPLIGQRYDFVHSDFQRAWHGHPKPDVDIAIMNLLPVLVRIQAGGQQVYFASVHQSVIPTPESARTLDAVEDVLFVGYPSGIYDAKNLMPIVRRGITATPFEVDYNGEPKFLIDASVFPGSSGSPVFFPTAGWVREGNKHSRHEYVLFLGVIAEVATREERGRIDFEPIPTQDVPIVRMSQMLNLGIVYKSLTVLETIQDFLNVRGEEI